LAFIASTLKQVKLKQKSKLKQASKALGNLSSSVFMNEGLMHKYLKLRK
jgi:hypothetical protein